MASGTIKTIYTDAVEGESHSSTRVASPGEVVDRDICCLAYGFDSDDLYSVELQFACMELESKNVTTVYADGVCT